MIVGRDEEIARGGGRRLQRGEGARVSALDLASWCLPGDSVTPSEARQGRQSDSDLVRNYASPWRCSPGTRVARCQPVVTQQSRNRRQDHRTRVSWPVVIETKTHRFPCQVVDISSNGAKVMTSARLQPGSVVRLQIIPPDGTRLRVGALVWRLDADGVAFLFARSIHHPFIRAA